MALRKSAAVNSSQWVESLACGHSSVEPRKNKTNEISSLHMRFLRGAHFSIPAKRKPDGLNQHETRLPRQGRSYSGNHPVFQNQAMISPGPNEETELSAVADYNRSCLSDRARYGR